MQPSEKSEEIDSFLTSLFGVNRKASILANTCVSCGKPAEGFTDRLSEKEFAISGLCQQCQDSPFAEPDDDSED